MGKNTFLSVGKLPNRETVVVSRDRTLERDFGVKVCDIGDIGKIVEKSGDIDNPQVFFIGGAQLINEMF